MKRYLPIAMGVLVAAGCVRLGFWQLDRLAERRARNAEIARQMEPAALRGTFAFDRQVVEMARSRNGAPGVYVLTPLVLEDGRRVLVNRGWVYSPDARTVDLARLAEPAGTTVEGVFVPPRRDPRAVRPDTLDPTYAQMILRRTVRPPDAPEALVPLDAPTLDDGPHLSYAVQWFIFGTIALVGGVLLFQREGGTAVGR